ncbi:MAG: TetR/AcrR family transcriptional regulator [Oscillospiraceae bacterium]
MPKQTFFNLPEDKRRHILDAAVDEFAERGYKLAGVSRIVSRAGIAKGSFYQYFEDLDDLYCHLLDVAIAQPKTRVMEQEQDKLAELSLTEFLRVAFHRQLEEFSERPKVMKIALDFLSMQGEPIYRKVMGRYRSDMDGYFLPYIRYEVEEGELDPAVNQQLLNFMLTSIGQYLTFLLASGEATAVSHDLVEKLVDDLEYILKHGIYRGTGNAQ